MNKENCALKLVDEIILYYGARSKKHQIVCGGKAISITDSECQHEKRMHIIILSPVACTGKQYFFHTTS